MLSLFPFPFLHVTVFVSHGSVSVRVTVEPPTLVPLSFWPGEHTVPTFLVLLVLTYIFFPIRHGERSVTVHLALTPGAFVLLAISIRVNSMPFEYSILKVPFVYCPFR